MHLSSIVFTLVTFIVGYQAVKGFGRILDNIRMGRSEPVTGDAAIRWRRVVLIAFGQQKMFKRLLPAVLHFFIYAAFLLTQVELIEILIDGFTAGHRSLAHVLGPFYTVLIGFIELLSMLALVATVVFLARRNLLRLPRFWKAEMTAWPRLDRQPDPARRDPARGGDLHDERRGLRPARTGSGPLPAGGGFPVSAFLGPALFGGLPTDWLMWLERLGWWGHVLIVFAFIVYLPYSKHLHIFLAFFNAYFARLSPRGRMANMPEIQREVRSMLGLPVDSDREAIHPAWNSGRRTSPSCRGARSSAPTAARSAAAARPFARPTSPARSSPRERS